ncbi:cytochrome c biogenesis protein/redoxin [Cedecea davisae]|uniref:cytochrome c biogenesis protein/redoxin n=1 Tax=Cedecea davisae TaxID=158484 RepID=UPI001D0A2480|nr:cytochrome c biogenesis protein/redoxin [Cedecea davisae]
MTVLIAFLGGILSLLSPCTLPVIPLLFAAFRGKKRQIVALFAGMVTMFTAVALLVSAAGEWIVKATLVGRWVALAMLALAALTLIFPHLAGRLTRPAVQLGNAINDKSNRTRGTLSAFLAGLAVGLLWSPCAGPILGAILGIGLSGSSTVTAGLLLAAYGSGCALMLALLWFCGYRILARLREKMALMEQLRRVAGVAMLATVALIASGTTSALQNANGVGAKLEQHLLTLSPLTTAAPKLQPIVETAPSSAMPSLAGGTAWINSPALTPEALKGKVVLIDFWTFDCINCQHSLPHVREWANKYKDRGLVVIGVHTPEYPWEKDLDSVKKAVTKWQLPYPVVTDNNYQIWNAFGNQYWPAHYYFDARGQLRNVSFGEGNYAQQEQVIQKLLQEAHT